MWNTAASARCRSKAAVAFSHAAGRPAPPRADGQLEPLAVARARAILCDPSGEGAPLGAHPKRRCASTRQPQMVQPCSCRVLIALKAYHTERWRMTAAVPPMT